MRIAIQPDLLQGESFSARWAEQLRELGHTVELVSFRDADFLERVKACDGFLWWFPPVPFPRELGKRLLAALDQGTDVVVHPDWRSSWHFDDKVAQTYLLQAAGIPMPRTRILWSHGEAMDFLRTAAYPLVTKLSSGFRSQNVGLLRNRAEAERLAQRLFGDGALAVEAPPLATLRNVARPLRNWLRLRAGKAPRRLPDVQRNCMLVQELVTGNDFDTRVTIIGNRAFAWRRGNAPGDFRASGSGREDLDPARIDPAAIRLGFRTARTLGMPTAAMDMLRRDGEVVVTEVSYYFEPFMLRRCRGHWRTDGDELHWVEGPVQPEAAILDDFLERVAVAR